jgi:hypothetical protein
VRSTSKVTKVDFEIAFTALIATSVITFPSREIPEYSFIKYLALGLLLLTLIRRLAIVNGVNSSSGYMEATTHLLALFTYLTLLYLLYKASNHFVKVIELPASANLVFFILTPIVSVSILLLEFYILNSGFDTIERTVSKMGSRFSGRVRIGYYKFAVWLGKIQNRKEDQLRQSKMIEYSTDYKKSVGVNPMYYLLFLFALGLILLPLGVLVWSSQLLFGFTMLFSISLLFSVLSIVGLVDLWYLRYGLSDATEQYGPYSLTMTILTYIIFGNIIS